VIAVGNFKGGVSKTTTSATLAQGLSLRGHTVLLIDTDPQGSLTSLMGIAPETLNDEDTVLSLTTGNVDTLDNAIQPTYWSNIHIIAAAPRISGSQFYLPERVKAGQKFWTVISDGLSQDVRDMYDIIIIDTPPSLDYLTINAFYCADMLIVPLPPSAMDFVSSTHFFDLFIELNKEFSKYGWKKEYNYVNILLSRVDSNDSASTLVREWISEAYGKHVLPVEIPSTAAAKNAAADFGTIYDATPTQQISRTNRRAYEAYDRFVEIIEDQVVRIWQSEGNIKNGDTHGNT
jgi:chromosome partitioning protein